MEKVRKIKCIKDSLFTNEGDIMIEYGLDLKGTFYFEGEEKLTGKGLPIDDVMGLKDKKFSDYFEEIGEVPFIDTQWGQNISYQIKEEIDRQRTQKRNLDSQSEKIAQKILDATTQYQVIFDASPEPDNNYDFDLSDEEVNYA